ESEEALSSRDDAGRAVHVAGVTSDVTTDHERHEAMARAASSALAAAAAAERARAEAEAVKEEMMAAYAEAYAKLHTARAAADEAGGFKNTVPPGGTPEQ